VLFLKELRHDISLRFLIFLLGIVKLKEITKYKNEKTETYKRINNKQRRNEDAGITMEKVNAHCKQQNLKIEAIFF